MKHPTQAENPFNVKPGDKWKDKKPGKNGIVREFVVREIILKDNDDRYYAQVANAPSGRGGTIRLDRFGEYVLVGEQVDRA